MAPTANCAYSHKQLCPDTYVHFQQPQLAAQLKKKKKSRNQQIPAIAILSGAERLYECSLGLHNSMSGYCLHPVSIPYKTENIHLLEFSSTLRPGSHWCDAGNAEIPVLFPHHIEITLCSCNLLRVSFKRHLKGSSQRAMRLSEQDRMGMNTRAIRLHCEHKKTFLWMRCTGSHVVCTGMRLGRKASWPLFAL